MKKSEFNNLLKQSTNIEINLIKNNQKEWEANVRGQHKDMTKTEVGFSNKQLEQLKNLIVEIVSPMVRTIIKEEVPPMVRTIIKEEVPPMIDQKLDPIKKDLEAIKNCPTIKKELGK